jgi:hypothetical protein
MDKEFEAHPCFAYYVNVHDHNRNGLWPTVVRLIRSCYSRVDTVLDQFSINPSNGSGRIH